LQTSEDDREDEPPVGTLTNLDPSQVGLLFDGETKAFSGADFTLFVDGGQEGEGGVRLTFLPNDQIPEGDQLPEGGSDDIEFVGIASSTVADSITVYHDTTDDPPPLHLTNPATGVQGGAALVGFQGNGNFFCESCDFFKWGGWGAAISFENEPYEGDEGGPTHTSVLALGWWVGGTLPTIGQLPAQGTATYDGRAIGSVAAYVPNGDYQQWVAYVATGEAHMDWDFAQRAGHLDITNFDPNGPYGTLNVHGRMSMPGVLTDVNKFSGQLLGTLGGNWCNSVTGSAVGSFVANGSDPTAGVIGNWGVGNENYVAAGVFGAGRNGAVDVNGQLPPVFDNDGGYNRYSSFPHGH